MAEPVLIERAELEWLIDQISDLQRAMKELFENAGNPDSVEGRCARIQLRLGGMRELLTVFRY